MYALLCWNTDMIIARLFPAMQNTVKQMSYKNLCWKSYTRLIFALQKYILKHKPGGVVFASWKMHGLFI